MKQIFLSFKDSPMPPLRLAYVLLQGNRDHPKIDTISDLTLSDGTITEMHCSYLFPTLILQL